MSKVTISSGNRKMGNIYNISLPTSVCRADAPCHKGCYAKRGSYCFKNVQDCYTSNLKAFIEDSEDFKMQILKQLPLYGVFRWHSSGDIVNDRYFGIMVEIAELAPNVKFLCFTKKYDIVNNFKGVVPSNLKMVFSGWKGLELDNPNDLPVAWMYDHKDIDERIPTDAIPCNGDCAQCMVCWKLESKESVVFTKH